MQGAGERRLAAAGEAGEEDHEAALVVVGLVLVDDGGDLVGPLALAADREHVAGGVVGRHLLAELVVVVGVAVGGERRGDDVGVVSTDHSLRSLLDRPVAGCREGRADQADGGDVLGGAGAVQREEHDGTAGRRLLDQGQVLVGERRGDRDDQRSVVLPACLGRGQVQPPERAVGGRRELGQRARGVHSASGQALGVDELDLGGVGELGREEQRDPGSETSRSSSSGASAPDSSSSRSSSSRGLGQCCGAGTGQWCQNGRPIASDAWPAPVVIAEIVRSGFVEGHHYGSWVVLDRDGTVLAAAGDVESPMLPRSCNKPIQALGMLEAGLSLDGELLALACASHSGEPFHVEGVRRILARRGLDEGALQTPPDWPAGRRPPRGADPGR